MKISLHEITIRDLFAGYLDSQEEGVVAYGGRLDVRPKYQREFVYTGKQREEVINSASSSTTRRNSRLSSQPCSTATP